MFGFGRRKQGEPSAPVRTALIDWGYVHELPVEPTQALGAVGVAKSGRESIVLYETGIDSHRREWFPHQGWDETTLALLADRKIK